MRTKGLGTRGEVLDEFGDVLRTRKSMMEAARELRSTMTIVEQLLWDVLRKNAKGIKFYAQAPIDRFIVDFYCPRERLIIEVDGGIHQHTDIAEHDLLREEFLQSKDLRILCFSNEEVVRDLHGVCRRILEACYKTAHTHSLSAPQCGEG